MQTRAAGLVLAAGLGRRMGGPKALLEVEGIALVRRHVERLAEAGFQPQVVVVRSAWAELVRGLLAGTSAHVLAGDAASQSGSVALGVRALLALTGLSLAELTVAITPVDLLPVCVETLRALSMGLAPHWLAVTPRCLGRGGHPVLARGALLAQLLHGEPAPLRDVLARAGALRGYLEVADARVLGDLDTPEQAARVGASFGPGVT